jgi:hypothetical protein
VYCWFDSSLRYSLLGRLMVRQRTLNPSIEVRILAEQLSRFTSALLQEVNEYHERRRTKEAQGNDLQENRSRCQMNFKPSRDLTLFIVGLGGIIHETVVAPSSDPQLLVLFGAMIGLPAFLARDEKKQ